MGFSKLEEKYGKWEKNTSKFGRSSFGLIAEDLCISKSQFTVLISNKGTEGMYIRSIRNVEQLIQFDQNKKELAQSERQSNIVKFITVLLGLGLIALAVKTFKNSNESETLPTEVAFNNSHPLGVYFDGDFKGDYVSPYLGETEVQSYCPCSAYEGVWELESEYIIPLPSRKPGLYYVAKSSDVRIKCHKGASEEQRGKVLIGFENMHNELWIDKNLTPFSPKYFNQETKEYTQDFKELKLEGHPNFAKIADVYSCFYDEFTFDGNLVRRKGEPCGRYAENINEEVINQFEIDVKHILRNVISSMAQIECEPALNNYCNPNDLKEGQSVLNYNCMFKIKTENLGIGGGYPYQKNYRLVKQNYSDNLLCNCSE